MGDAEYFEQASGVIDPLSAGKQGDAYTEFCDRAMRKTTIIDGEIPTSPVYTKPQLKVERDLADIMPIIQNP